MVSAVDIAPRAVVGARIAILPPGLHHDPQAIVAAAIEHQVPWLQFVPSTLALFLDEEPTYGFFPPVYYYQGRVREGLKTAGFAESYRAYLALRGKSTDDPLLPDIRRRAGL